MRRAHRYAGDARFAAILHAIVCGPGRGAIVLKYHTGNLAAVEQTKILIGQIDARYQYTGTNLSGNFRSQPPCWYRRRHVGQRVVVIDDDEVSPARNADKRIRAGERVHSHRLQRRAARRRGWH